MVDKLQTKAAVIILTPKGSHDLAINIIDKGAEDYICKSSIEEDPSRLYDAIDFAMCRHHHSEEFKHQKDKAVNEKDWLVEFVAGNYSVNKK